MTDALRDTVRATLWAEVDEAAALDRIARCLDAEFAADPRPRGRHRGRGRRTTLLFAMLAILVVGSAAFAAPAVHRQLFGDDPEAPANQMEVFRRDDQLVNGMSVFDSRQPDGETIAEQMLLGHRPWRARSEQEFGTKLGREHVRRLLEYEDDIGPVEVVAVPTDRGNLCYATMSIPGGGTSSCIEAFDPERHVMFTQSTDGTRRILLVGLASDEVDRITLRVRDRDVAATMGTNAFAWRGDPGEQPTKLIVHLRDGTTVEMTPPDVFGMSRDPSASYSPDPDRIAGVDSPVSPDADTQHMSIFTNGERATIEDELLSMFERSFDDAASAVVPDRAQQLLEHRFGDRRIVLIGVPMRDGNVCLGMAEYSARGSGGRVASCAARLKDAPIAFGVGRELHSPPLIHGIHRDGVLRVRVRVGWNGPLQDAVMGRNAFLWRGRSATDVARQLVVEFDDGSTRTYSATTAVAEDVDARTPPTR